MNITINEDVLAALEDLGVTEDDVREVVEYGEAEQKMYDDEGNNVSKKRLDALMVYAQYTVDGDTAAVNRVYKHRVSLQEEL